MNGQMQFLAGEPFSAPPALACRRGDQEQPTALSEALFGAILEEQRRVSDLIVRHKSGWAACSAT
jgi:hypothetical protein